MIRGTTLLGGGGIAGIAGISFLVSALIRCGYPLKNSIQVHGLSVLPYPVHALSNYTHLLVFDVPDRRRPPPTIPVCTAWEATHNTSSPSVCHYTTALKTAQFLQFSYNMEYSYVCFNAHYTMITHGTSIPGHAPLNGKVSILSSLTLSTSSCLLPPARQPILLYYHTYLTYSLQ